jgi:phospholipid transport system transporter-binding protein
VINFSNQEMRLSGQITYDNAESYYQQGLKVIQSQSYPVVVNLAQLEHGSTLALAVLVRWLRQTPDARSLHPITHYVNMIMGLLSILCSFSLKSYHSMCKFYSFFNLTVCVVRTAKSPPVGGGPGRIKIS